MSADCIFCKIIAGELPTTVVYETDDVLAFPDLHAQAPHHYLIIPKQHIASLKEATDEIILGKLLLAAKQVAINAGIADSGFRTNINCGDDGGQTVYHIHVHVLGGRRMTWPPG